MPLPVPARLHRLRHQRPRCTRAAVVCAATGPAASQRAGGCDTRCCTHAVADAHTGGTRAIGQPTQPTPIAQPPQYRCPSRQRACGCGDAPKAPAAVDVTVAPATPAPTSQPSATPAAPTPATVTPAAKAPAAAATPVTSATPAGAAVCGLCACKHFRAQAWRKNVCMDCGHAVGSHAAVSHAATVPASPAAPAHAAAAHAPPATPHAHTAHTPVHTAAHTTMHTPAHTPAHAAAHTPVHGTTHTPASSKPTPTVAGACIAFKPHAWKQGVCANCSRDLSFHQQQKTATPASCDATLCPSVCSETDGRGRCRGSLSAALRRQLRAPRSLSMRHLHLRQRPAAGLHRHQ